MKCYICGRPIKSAESLRTGLGPTCREHRAAVDQPELFDTGERQGKPVVKKSLTVDVIDFDNLRGR